LENPEQLAPNAIPSIFDYAQNPDKTENNQLIRGYECFPELADEQFATSHELYEINTGRTPKINSRLLYHMRQSFAPGEIDPQVANRIGYELALEFTGGNHQFVVATHTDKAHIHNHIIINAINLDCNGKFKDPLYSGRRDVARISDKLCKEYGLSVIEHKQGWREPYNEWEKKHGIMPENKPLSKRKRLEEIIGFCLDKKPKDFDTLLKYLEEYSCYAKRRGSNISITTPFAKKPIRLSSLSGEFDEHGIRSQIAEQQKVYQQVQNISTASNNEDEYDDAECENAYVPVAEVKPAIPTKLEISLQSILQFSNHHNLKLIIDIQNSMKATESIGYKRWCEKFNLEQMSQTLIFIEKHQLTVEKLRNIVTVNANAPNEIKSEIATLDRKLDNISEMQRHFGTLGKTKKIYKQYTQSANPAQFKQDNLKSLTAYSEASKYFNENGYGTWGGFEMPKFADTQKRYAETLAEKKKLWARYHAMKNEIGEAKNAWANVKTLLNVQDEIEIAPKVRRQSGPSL